VSRTAPDLVPEPTAAPRSAPRKSQATYTEGTQSIQRAIAVLREIAAHSPRGMRLVDIAAKLQIERATAHRIMKGLNVYGMTMRDPRTNHYKLGPAVHALGLASSVHYSLAEVCEPSLIRLAEASGDSIFLMVRSGYDAVCLRRVEGSFPLQTHSLDTGTRRPLGAGAGALALLTVLEDSEIEHIIEVNTPRLEGYRIKEPEALRIAVEQSRQLGYGMNQELQTPGICAIGMVVPLAHGVPYVALSIASSSSRMRTRRDELAALLTTEVTQLAKLLANQPPWI
jgi:DNA-binding IclR family transcriptional regulator